MKTKFDLGMLVATRGVDEKCKEDMAFAIFCYDCVLRHQTGDWGDLCDEDKEINELALKTGEDRLFSKYDYDADTSIYIITEWDRSVTTVLFPDEY